MFEDIRTDRRMAMSSPLQDAANEYIASKGGGDGVFRTPIDALSLMRSSTKTIPYITFTGLRSAWWFRAQNRSRLASIC